MLDNKIVRESLIFLAGATIGGVGTWLIAKTHYKKFADKEIAEVKEHYQKKLDEVALEEASFEEATGLTTEDYNEQLIERKKLAKKAHNKPQMTDYTKFYKDDGTKPTVESTLAEMEHPRDSDEEDYDPQDDSKLVEEEFSEPDPEADDHEEENIAAGERMMEQDAAMESNRDPFVIAEEIFYADDNRNGQESLFYYTENDTLANANDEVVENRELIVGDWLENPEWDESGVMYIRNPTLHVDYEVTRVEAEFELD